MYNDSLIAVLRWIAGVILGLLFILILISFIGSLVCSKAYAQESDYSKNINKWLDKVLKEEIINKADIKEKCLQSFYKQPYYVYYYNIKTGSCWMKLDKQGNVIRCGR